MPSVLHHSEKTFHLPTSIQAYIEHAHSDPLQTCQYAGVDPRSQTHHFKVCGLLCNTDLFIWDCKSGLMGSRNKGPIRIGISTHIRQYVVSQMRCSIIHMHPLKHLSLHVLRGTWTQPPHLFLLLMLHDSETHSDKSINCPLTMLLIGKWWLMSSFWAFEPLEVKDFA